MTRLVLGGAVVVSIAGLIAWAVRSNADDRRIGDDSIVLLGDSITAEGQWDRLLPDRPLVNEGHPGFTTAQLVPVAERVAAADPAVVIILTGTNDIRDGHPPTWTRERLEVLVDRLEDGSQATIVVQTVLPRADRSAAVRQVNVEVRELAEQRGLGLLDLYETFDDGTGALRDHETYDGLHLTEDGYRRWANELEAVLADVD
ncbi:MAG: GDSL-type esterase/lipase family protein [Ilumatobacter fluminis]|uniref:GDSL-type esterase/lipase family protein n=1 Tax=Ilumatobacter fluminis TaxID=467091 RepID=UPI0032EC7838